MYSWNLRYVLTVGEERSISKAAKKLYTSQPALSLRVKKLEKQLGIQLFDRETLPLRMTYAGERFVAIASQIVDLEGQLFQEMGDINRCAKGRLRVGISPLRERSVLPVVLPVYRQRFPGIEVVLVEEKFNVLEGLTLNGKTDLWITNYPLKKDLTITNFPLKVNQLEYTPFRLDEILAVVPDRYLPAGIDKRRYRSPDNNGPEIDLALLKESPFILLKPGMRIRRVSEALFSDAGIHKPDILLESESIDALFELTVRGVASSLIHQSFIPRTHQGAYYYLNDPLPISFLRLNNPKAKSVLAAVYLKNRYLSKAAKEFIAVAKELLAFAPGSSRKRVSLA
jgi:DNA-binding transcriptional LysR family regulator